MVMKMTPLIELLHFRSIYYYDEYYDTSAEVYAELLTFEANYPDIVESLHAN